MEPDDPRELKYKLIYLYIIYIYIYIPTFPIIMYIYIIIFIYIYISMISKQLKPKIPLMITPYITVKINGKGL